MAPLEVSKEVGYINRIIRNVRNIKKSELKPFFEDLNSADCIILVGEGRSQSALHIGMVDIDFPGRNIVEAAPVLERRYDSIALLVSSGSGETTTPKVVTKQLSDYIEHEKSNKFTINTVVSNVNSSIGRIVDKEYSTVLELKGRDRKPDTTNAFLKHGIMNDVYELGSLLLFQKIKEAMNEKGDYKLVFKKVEEESAAIGDIVDTFVRSSLY